MRAEAAFIQGRFADAQIELEGAYAQIEGNGQENMALCCDFLARRLFLCTEMKQRHTFEQRRAALLRQHNTAWINIFNSICAYYYALLGQPEKIPPVFGEHMLSTVNFLAPGKPMMEMIENQVYLAQGAYAKVVGRSEGLLAMCDGLHYALVALHVRIQTAAAYAMLGKGEEALALLERALGDAAPDSYILPFAENYHYLKDTLPACGRGEDEAFLRQIMELGAVCERRRETLLRGNAYPAAFGALTDRELELAELIAARLSNREIAEKLFLSEGSVKQYVNQLYSKLCIEGDTRTKRKRLAEMMGKS